MTATTETSERQQTKDGRDGKGRFAKGNKGGPGNPFARQVAMLRKTLVNFVTEEDMKHIAFVLKMKAESGDIEAIKILFQYVIGKPTDVVDPDSLDIDEWELMQEQSRPPQEMSEVMAGLPADTACTLSKIAWPCAVETQFKQPFLAGLQELDRQDETLAKASQKKDKDCRQEEADRAAMEEAAALAGIGRSMFGDWQDTGPSPNGGNGASAPSPNGSNGQSRRARKRGRRGKRR
jgi:hypothetical protein